MIEEMSIGGDYREGQTENIRKIKSQVERRLKKRKSAENMFYNLYLNNV